MTHLRMIPMYIGLLMAGGFAAPYHGDTLTLRQPDGSLVQARAFGDEFYVRLESLDGYTLTQDPVTRWFQYAELDTAASKFVSTGVVYSGSTARGAARSPASQAPRRLAKGQTLPEQAWRARRAENHSSLMGSRPQARSGFSAPEPAATIGEIRGLTLLVDFADDPATIPQSRIDSFLNQPGYSGYGNNGSIRDYFRDVSGGQVTYVNTTAAYYRAQNPKTYYTNSVYPLGEKARELALEALLYLDAQGFDFSTLSRDDFGNIRALNILYAGYIQNAWSEGLWPHQGWMGSVFAADGVTSGAYQISNLGNELTMATFCHENGHMLFGWPDLYDYTYESLGVGDYCLMAYQGSSLNPVPPNPYLRKLAGWEPGTIIPSLPGSATYTHVSNSYSHFRFENPAAPGESFLIESRRREGRNASLPDEGLIVWHVDESGSNDYHDRTPERHYKVSVEQADGLFELERGTGFSGDGDLFHAGYRAEFADWTVPDSRWWSGERSGLSLVNIGPVGASQSFTVQAGGYPAVDIGNPGVAGTVTEAGGTVVLEGGGSDIWGSADQFFFRFGTLRGDGEVIVRIQSLENTHMWAKAGVMIRENTSAGSRNAFMAISPASGITLQSRSAANGSTVSVLTPGTPPRWLRLVRRGSNFAGYHSFDGVAWTAFGTAVVPMGESALAGIAVTSHSNATLASAVTTGFRILPSPWKASNLGTPALSGSYAYGPSDDSWTVRGAGTDIWYIADQGYYLQQPFTGEGRLIARVKSLVNTAPGAKAGLMIRSSLAAGSANVFMGISAAEGATFQRRTTNGGTTSSTKQAGLVAPRWVKLEARNGSLIGSQSANGTAWTEVARVAASFPYAMGGLALTSHNAGQLTTAVFDKVDIRRGFPDLIVSVFGRTEISGNGNGEINPGEEFYLDVGLQNVGTDTAKGVIADLSSTLSCLTFVSGTAAYGDIAPGSFSSRQSFRMRVSASCPAQDTELRLRLADAFGERWERSITLQIKVSASVSGTVRSPAGPPPPGAFVECASFPYYDFITGITANPDGTYIIERLPPDEYICRAWAPDYPDTPSVRFTLPPSRTGVDFLLSRPLATVAPASFDETLGSGQSRSVPMTISNPGDATLSFNAFNLQAGYVWRDSDAPGGPVFSWTDIRATGVRLAMTDGMYGSLGFRTLGFSFPMYGSAYRSLVVFPTGYVAFTEGIPFSYNVRMPEPYAPPNMIAGFWDEIWPEGTQGAIYFQEYGDRAVIQYDQLPRYLGAGTYTFQIVLYRDGTIRFNYKTMAETNSATVGIQNAARDRAVNIVTDAPYVKDNFTVEIKPTAKDWLTVSPASGTVGPGSSRSLLVTLDAAGLPAGPYKSEVMVTHNVFNKAPFILPAQLTVQGSAGGVRRQVWTGVVGSTLAPLLHLSTYPNSPTFTEIIPGFESPRNYADNFGEKLSAYIVPPVTGDYTFWIAGDDQSELRLSPDELPGKAVLIARTPNYTTFRNWNGWPEQRSAAIRLTAGRRYYIEALHKEGLSADHLSVGWQGPGITGDSERPIPGTRLIPFVPNAGIVSRSLAGGVEIGPATMNHGTRP